MLGFTNSSEFTAREQVMGEVRFGAEPANDSSRPEANIQKTGSPQATRMRPNFNDIAGLWERDGSLRDVYVQNTEAIHWDRFDRLLNQYEYTYSFDGAALPFPGSRNVLANREGSHLLSILLDGPVVICCHFFVSEQLELDISPKEVAGSLQHEQVLSFVENLAETLELPVDITPENCEKNPFLTYVSQAKSWYIPGDPQ